VGLGVGLGGGWQLGLQLPLERRSVDVTYTLGGAPYDPPYQDIHHRDEIVQGLADGQAAVQRLGRAAAGVWMAELGSTLPVGQTHPDPYAAGARGERHQHNQLGLGAPAPFAAAAWVGAPKPVGALGSARVQAPLIENQHGMRGPLLLVGAGGANARLSPEVVGMAQAELVIEGPERWSGEAQGGRAALSLALATEWAPGPRLSLLGDLRLPVASWLGSAATASEEHGRLQVGPLVGLTVAWTAAR
jgi:hypothetical protein